MGFARCVIPTPTPTLTPTPFYTCDAFCVSPTECDTSGAANLTCPAGEMCCDILNPGVTPTATPTRRPTAVPTRRPTAVPTRRPTAVPTGSSVGDDPTPTTSRGDQGCKPCPNSSSRVEAGITSYSCTTNGAGLEDFTLWQEDYRRVFIDGVEIPTNELYADYNCNGAIDIADFSLWLENYRLENYN